MLRPPIDWSRWDPWKPVPARYNLGTALTAGNVAAGLGERGALFWENSRGDERAITYRETDELSTRFAAALARRGVKRGDRVFLRLPNLPEFYVAALGAAKLGAVFIPSSTMFREGEIEYRLNDSGAVAAVTTPQLYGPVENVRGTCPSLRHVIAVPYLDEPAPAGTLNWQELLAQPADNFQAADTANDDIAFIAYTSGTTGDPKGVVHMHRYAVAYDSLIIGWHDYRGTGGGGQESGGSGQFVATRFSGSGGPPEGGHYEPSRRPPSALRHKPVVPPDCDVVACPAEMGWLLPVASTFLYAMRCGLSIVLYHPIDGRFDPAAWFRLFEKYRITNFTGTPTVYRMLIAAPDEAKRRDLGALRHGVSAGEPLPEDTFEAAKKLFGFEVLDGIGMSECMVYCFNRVDLPVRPGSCGMPGPGTDIRLVDLVSDSGTGVSPVDLREVAAGEPGVLCLRRATHPGMMREYWRKPEQTAEIFRGEWYWSGDVLARDSDGYFWFQGRADDVMKASGYRISPFEVESCLVSHPAVLEAAAVESPDPVRGMVVKAFIVLRAGQQPSDALAAEIQNWVKQHAAPYKYPRKVEFVEALPKTQSGKIKRRELREKERRG